jgi:AhpD family alkylhydroperoxidase
MKHPAFVLPDALQALYALDKSTDKDGLPFVTRKLAHLRASQINGCSVCVIMHAAELRKSGESDDTPYFNEAERAALALAEAMTRLSDRTDPVPDDVWADAAKHYDEKALSALLVSISLINVWNRLNVAVKQVAGAVWNRAA